MFLHSLAYLFQLGYKQPNAKYQIFYFQVYGNMVEENRMYQQLQKMCREKVCLKSFSGKISLCTLKNCLLLHLCVQLLCGLVETSS